tara:strand:- start:26 stop:301 length:276 start_codon:yes stop_codon:yes gene_type:complete
VIFVLEHHEQEILVCAVEASEEAMKEKEAIAEAIETAVEETHGLLLNGIAFVKDDSLPRTSAGTVIRETVKEQYHSGALSVNWEVCLLINI